MKGFMGLQNFMMKPAKVPSHLSGQGAGQAKSADKPATSFQKFLRQQQGQNINPTQTTKSLNEEEKKLLKQSFLFLIDFKKQLGEKVEVTGPKTPLNKKLRKLLEDMSQNADFMAMLPNHMKEILANYLQQTTGTFDPKTIEALVGEWNQFKLQQANPLKAETEDLINTIKTRLNQAGIQVDVQEGENGSSKVVFTETEEAKNSVLVKSLLNRISTFLNKTENVKEKAALKDETFELRDSLRKYLHKGQQPVGWDKERLVHNAQNATLRRLETEQKEGAAKQQLSVLNGEKLVKEETKNLGLGVVKTTSENEEESSVSMKKVDQSVGVFLNSESDQTQMKMVKENHRGQRFFSQPEEIFSQMVEKFRLQVRDGASQMEIQLHPEELGRMRLSLSIEEGVVTARLLTGNVHVKELIEQNLPQLKETFAKEGLRWDEITVDVSQDDLGGNAFSSQGQENLNDRRGQSRKRRGFSDFMDENFELDDVAALEEEESKRDPDRLLDYMA